MVLVALFTRASFWLPVSKPPGNALSVETQIKRRYPHTLSVTHVSYSRGRRQLASDVAYCYCGGVLWLPSTALHLFWWEQWHRGARRLGGLDGKYQGGVVCPMTVLQRLRVALCLQEAFSRTEWELMDSNDL